MSAKTSRRHLLGAFAAAAPAALLPAAASHAAPLTPAPQKWDRTVDFLVVGTGFAGLAAALEAHYAGIKDVLVLEKMPSAGGNSIINGGGIAASGTDMQKERGIEDSPDLFFKDILKAGGYINHPDLARRIADESVPTFEWLRGEIGVKFADVYYHGGHSVKRSHTVVEKSGAGFINPMLAKCREFGIPVELRTKVEHLIEDEKGRVIGAQVRRSWRFGREGSGRLETIRARMGILLASGGFSQNVVMRMSHDPRLTEAFGSTNHPGATGEMIQEAQMHGANTLHMDWIQLGPWTSPDEKGFGLAPQFVESIVGYGCMVDIATGKRFFKETGNRKERADAIIAIGHPALIYASEKNVQAQTPKAMKKETFEAALKQGVIRRFDTLDELAAFYKIPADALKAQNERMNGFLKAKKDPDLGCMFFEDSQPNDAGPFYAARLWPRVHHTMGGLEINNRAQVYNARHEVIPGLYAAGEVTGGVHGMVRLGTVAVADCIIFGRTAARSALADAKSAAA